MKILLFVLALATLLSPQIAFPQLHPARFIDFPLTPSDSTSGVFMPYCAFAAELTRAISKVTPPGDLDEDEVEMIEFQARDQAWNIKLGGLIDFYRFSSGLVLSGTAFNELNASARNDLGFNPRASIWEEQLLARNVAQFLGMNSSLGIFHRCKHDIDNTDEEFNDTPNPKTIQKRNIILSGISLTQALDSPQLNHLAHGIELRASARVEYYLYKSDYRYPEINFGNLWVNAQYALQLSANISYALSSSIRAVARLHTSEVSFAADPARARTEVFGNITRAELDVEFAGRASNFAVFVMRESSFDDVTRIAAEPYSLWSMGVKFCPRQ